MDEVIAGVLPEGKESTIRALKKNGKVAMVGDGINDAPALTRADIGMAIGAGTDVAIDAADVVLMKSRLSDVPAAIRLSRATLRNIHENLFWAFFYNVCGIPVAAGLLYPLFMIRLSPMIGAAAMSLSSVCVVANALRLRFFKGKTVPAVTAADEGKNRHPEERKEEGKEERNGAGQPSGKGEMKMEKVIEVEGMMCAHCQMHVQKALAAVEGVGEAVVDLEAKKATVTLLKEVSDENLMKAVADAGYTAVSCQTR